MMHGLRRNAIGYRRDHRDNLCRRAGQGQAHSAGRRSAALRLDTPDSFGPASARGGLAANGCSAVRRLRPVLAAALLVLPLHIGLTSGAAAQVEPKPNPECTDSTHEVGPGWALTPSGVNDGDKFRLLFVTSTRRDARSTNIDDYNAFVRTRAKAGHAGITDGCGDEFRVVGSTPTSNALSNAGIETTVTDVPIYWLNGAKVADDYADFLGGSWDSAAARDESGARHASAWFFTGSADGGTASAGQELGAASVTTGSRTGGLNSGNTQPGSGDGYFLALSPVFKVETPVSLSATRQSVSEGDAVRITAVMSGPRRTDTPVTVQTFAGTATADADYRAGSYTLTIPAGQTEGHQNIPTIDDNELGDPGNFLVRLFTNPSPGVIGVYPIQPSGTKSKSNPVRIPVRRSRPTAARRPTVTVGGTMVHRIAVPGSSCNHPTRPAPPVRVKSATKPAMAPSTARGLRARIRFHWRCACTTIGCDGIESTLALDGGLRCEADFGREP